LKVLLDTSALAKRYVQEPGSDELEELFRTTATEVFICSLALPEFAAALGRKVRNKEVPKKDASLASAEFEEDWNGLFKKIPLTENLADSAASLAIQYPLKGGDSVHLAAALAADVDLFVTSDQQLIKTSRKLGLEPYDPTRGPFRPSKH
jgi:predicted nucleic acid-binding protein